MRFLRWFWKELTDPGASILERKAEALRLTDLRLKRTINQWIQLKLRDFPDA